MPAENSKIVCTLVMLDEQSPLDHWSTQFLCHKLDQVEFSRSFLSVHNYYWKLWTILDCLVLFHVHLVWFKKDGCGLPPKISKGIILRQEKMRKIKNIITGTNLRNEPTHNMGCCKGDNSKPKVVLLVSSTNSEWK